MRYKIVFTNRAIKDLDKLDQTEKMRVGNNLKDYSINPLANSKKLSDPKIGTYRFRVGDYRVIFDLVDDEIVILRIGHRRNIYK